MPKVPKLTGPQTNLRNLPDISDNRNMNVPTTGVERLQQANRQQSKFMSDMYNQAKKEADALFVQRKNNELDTFSNNLLTGQRNEKGELVGGVLNLKGEKAIGATVGAMEEYDEFAKNATKGMSKDQILAFMGDEARRRSSIHDSLTKHEMAQTEAAKDDAAEAGLAINVDKIARDPMNEKTVSEANAATTRIMADLTKRKGYDRQTALNETVKALSRNHTSVIKARLQQGKTAEASRYFIANKNQMTGKDIIDVQPSLMKANTLASAQEAERISREDSKTIKIVNGKKIVGEPDFEKQMKILDALPDGKVKKEAKAIARQSRQDREHMKKVAEEKEWDQFWEWQQANPNTPPRNYPTWHELSNETQKQAEESFDTSNVDTSLFTEMDGLLPHQHAAMTNKQFHNKYIKKLPKEMIQSALKDRADKLEAHRKGAPITEGNTIQAIGKRVLGEYGTNDIGPESGKTLSEESTYFSNVLRITKENIRIKESNLKRKLNGDEIEKEFIAARRLRPLYTDTTLSIRGFGGPDAEVHDVKMMTGADILEKDVYLEVDENGDPLEDSKLGNVEGKINRQNYSDTKNMVERWWKNGGNLKPLPESYVDKVYHALLYDRFDIVNKLKEEIEKKAE